MLNKQKTGIKLINSVLASLITLVLSYVVIFFISFGLTFYYGVYLAVYTLKLGIIGFYLMVLCNLYFKPLKKIYFVIGAVGINLLLFVTWEFIDQKPKNNNSTNFDFIDLEGLFFVVIVSIVLSISYFILNKRIESK